MPRTEESEEADQDGEGSTGGEFNDDQDNESLGQRDLQVRDRETWFQARFVGPADGKDSAPWRVDGACRAAAFQRSPNSLGIHVHGCSLVLYLSEPTSTGDRRPPNL